ncbi:SpoIIE family protein phosphatase/ATP-binding protein [Peterkaempfera bronchialis]|uniref:protein-serine/threonine phosphatase n=1 Tax=Peterkaempfera bronchialis TaxID=2126346 RepID=A0A345T4D6_9ACTN|nr:GAF domain-containing protein [Peterkaempfera bronchialis]
MIEFFGRYRAWLARLLAGSRPRHRSSRRTRPRPPLPGLLPKLGVRSVAGQVFVLQVVVVALLVLVSTVALLLQSRYDITQDARDRSLAVAETLAEAPGTAQALTSANPTATLQPEARKLLLESDVDLVVVYGPNGIRYTDPDPALIGKHVFGAGAPPVRPSTRVIRTAAGPSVTSLVPVVDSAGATVGTVAVGVTVQNLNGELTRQLPVVLGAAGGALALATCSSLLVSRRLRRQTHGLGAGEMTRMYEHHDAVLHAVREGVLITGSDGRLVLANDEARRLLDLPSDAEGRPVAELGLDPETAGLLLSGRAVTDEVHLAGDRLLAVNTRDTALYGGGSGIVATLRDTTELRALSGRSEVARERLRLLYDAGVRIGTSLDVVRTAEELANVVVPRFADFVTVDLLDTVLRGEESPESADPLRRAAASGIRPGPPFLQVGEVVRSRLLPARTAGAARGRAVLDSHLASAHDWHAHDPGAARTALDHGIHSLITVPLRARDAVLGVVAFYRADASEPFEEEDLSFTEELAARAAVCIDNARRYTRERATAVTLQRSLLPRALPDQGALEVAYRYLPAQAGVGGDWFDVVPLPGARVALVVGDVVGHGLHAAATMGRLRTAVHNFSALDLSPDELLGHLDELVARMDQDAVFGGESATGVTGATCLYAIYDPASGRCVAARAGHPGPALVRPCGAVEFPEIPASPPLGLGSLPFETAEWELPAGTQLVLYTDGLVEDRLQDVDVGLERLRRVLASDDQVNRTPEETCQAVSDAMLPPHPSDDIALLVARTRRLDPTQVAEWGVPSDPAAVSRVRAECSRRLAEWGLEETGFATELVLSELITNAIRYGAQPIRVRMLCDHSLICEVSDGSSTSPHLRRAASTDEGGRGLFLVAQFAERWGTRYTPEGKVIWTEQPLHHGPAADVGGDSDSDILEQWDVPAL